MSQSRNIEPTIALQIREFPADIAEELESIARRFSPPTNRNGLIVHILREFILAEKIESTREGVAV